MEVFFAETIAQKGYRFAIFVFLSTLSVFMTRSVLSEVRRKKELEVANAKLRHLDKAKSEFISIASHQLRTPLSAIDGFVSLILEGTYGKISEKAREAVGEIAQSNQQLISLVNDLLNISRMELGKIKMEFEKVDVLEICRAVVRELSGKAEEKNLYLKLESEGDQELPGFADRKSLEQAISNIVENALKYTIKGGVTIAVAREGENVLIRIKDTGIGIAKNHLPFLFSKFSRGENAMKYSIPGTGLGLYVAKSLIEKNGGSILAESDGEGKGALFAVEFPVK
jgi:signal transduction histidine kinase